MEMTNSNVSEMNTEIKALKEEFKKRLKDAKTKKVNVGLFD